MSFDPPRLGDALESDEQEESAPQTPATDHLCYACSHSAVCAVARANECPDGPLATILLCRAFAPIP